MGKNWITKAVGKKGALHKALHVKAGEKIPAGKMEVKESDSPLMKKRKQLAQTLMKLKKGGSK